MQRLLVAFDDSPASHVALRWAIDDAAVRSRGVLLLYVISSIAEWELAAIQVNPDPIRREFEHLLQGRWSEPLREAGVEYSTRLRVGRPADEILSTARVERAVAIVMGMSTRGLLHEVILGTVARHVLHDALRPVIAVPEGWSVDASAVASPLSTTRTGVSD